MKMSSESSDHARSFSFRELANATNNFNSDNRLGEGGFGAVHKGVIEGTNQIVAVKQLNLKGLQGEREFLVEVLMLFLLNHPNIVKMIGYSSEGVQRAIVYEFLPLGSLENHLHHLKSGMQPLDWNTRMKIAAGTARGLRYLHHQANPTVIYRDLKSSNILLDEGFHPKLSDFGLAKFGPHAGMSHISTRIMGTYGYCAPEYAATGRLTFMSDVYSFGIVLLELLTGLSAMDETRPSGKQTLFEWARPMMNTRNYEPLVDPRLNGKYPASVLSKVVDVITMCVRYDAVNRPTMNQVVLAMDYLESVVV